MGAREGQAAVDLGVEGVDDQRGRHAVGEAERHHLVVDDVVVAPVDAAAVRPLAERPPSSRRAGVGRDHGDRPAVEVGEAFEVEVGGVVRAAGGGGAVEAALGRADGRPLGPEVGQVARRRDGGRRRAHPPGEQVEVVARLGEQLRARGGLAVPVAAHVAVGEVPGTDPLLVQQVHRLAQVAGVERPLHRAHHGGVAEDVGHGDVAVGGRGGGRHPFEVGERGGDGLLEQQVVAARQRCDRQVGVAGIGGGEDQRVGERRLRQQLGPVGEGPLRRHAVQPGGGLAAPRFGIGDRGHPTAPGVAQEPVGVDAGAAVAAADDGEGGGRAHGAERTAACAGEVAPREPDGVAVRRAPVAYFVSRSPRRAPIQSG